MARQEPIFDRTIRCRKMTTRDRTSARSVGLWAGASGKGGSFFENSRSIRTVDPTPNEVDILNSHEKRLVGKMRLAYSSAYDKRGRPTNL